jgi:hypothetical protein
MQLSAGRVGRELPGDGGARVVALVLPGRHLGADRRQGRQPPVQALRGQDGFPQVVHAGRVETGLPPNETGPSPHRSATFSGPNPGRANRSPGARITPSPLR